MLDPKMEKALNDQLNAELYSSYLYFSMSAWFESRNFSGFARWLLVQAQEELLHALKFSRFIIDRGGHVLGAAVERPAAEWNSPLDCFTAVLHHERLVTGRIYGLLDLARELHDHAVDSFLKWFVDEQVEEEKNAQLLVERLRMIDDSTGALLFLDHELGQRPLALTIVPAELQGVAG